jgi:hypothetical protein
MQQSFKSFAIVLDEEQPEKNTNCFQRLVNALGKKLTNHRPGTVASQNILKMYRTVKKEATYGDAFIIRNNSFEFDLVKKAKARRLFWDSLREEGSFFDVEPKAKKYNLMRDFETLVELLSSLCCEERSRPEVEIEVTVEVPRPKKLRKVTTYEKVTILERWVKIGYKLYRRHFDAFTGDEYIVVNGDVYYIKENRCGQEYLA